MLAKRAIYEMNFDKIEKAKIYIEKIKTEFPEYKMPAQLKAVTSI